MQELNDRLVPMNMLPVWRVSSESMKNRETGRYKGSEGCYELKGRNKGSNIQR